MASSESSGSPIDSPLQSPTSGHRSARSSFSELTTRSAPKGRRLKETPSIRDVAQIFVKREREAIDLNRTMYTLSEQLKAERQRAEAAEDKTREVLNLLKKTNEAKKVAEQDAARANEELRLWKLQYENAQQEITRAQALLDALDKQRGQAEEAAANARSKARKLKEENIVMRAREEGRRQGLEEGMAQGRLMGYEEGRAVGYEHGRVAAEREFTSAPVTEMDYETPRTREYQPPRVLRPSTSEDSEQHDIPDYGQTMQDVEPSPPTPTRPPIRTPTPAGADREQSPIHPIPIHTAMLSPSHAPVEIPPDGWIPNMDGDNRIRLPPPHEMAPPPPTPSPPLSAVLNNVKNIEDPPVMMIPPPAHPRGESSNSRIKHHRRRSTDSHSTTMSQFEILGPPLATPAPAPSTLRNNARERPNVLSAIAEERERTSSASSPVYVMPNLSTQSFGMPVPTPGMPTPSIHPSPSQANTGVPPQNPTYPDATPRYARSTENLARSGEDYFNRANTTRYGSEASYRSGEQNTRSQEALRERDRRERERIERERERIEHERRERERIEREREQERSRLELDRMARERELLVKERERMERERLQQERERLDRERERLRELPGRSPDYGGGRYGDNTTRRQPSMQNIYAPPHSPHSSPDTPTSRTPAIIAPAHGLRQLPTAMNSDNRGSMSSGEIPITIQPPSRPESNISISRTEGGVFLSADDADRPLPPLEETPAEVPHAPASPVIPSSMSTGALPPGFVPTAPPSPAGSSAVGPAGVPLPPSSYGGSTVGAAGVPLPPSIYGGTPSMRSETVIPGGFPGSEGPPPVIPSSRSSTSAGPARSAPQPYSRANITRREDDSDSTVSSGLGSSDSFTTPPTRTRKLSTRATPSYAAAPLPAGMQYPVPPTPRSSTSNSQGSYTTASRAARVPLPASVSGSVVGSMAGGFPPRSGSVVSGVRPPSAAGADRPRSPRMGGGRNPSSPSMHSAGLPYEPVIPIPIPDPSPITVPVQMPASPMRPTTPLADIDPPRVIPQFARAPSPVASTVSAATNATNTTKGKKGRKKR